MKLFLFLVGGFATLFPLASFAQSVVASGAGYDGFPYMMGFGFGFFGIIFMILFGVLVIMCLISLIRWFVFQNKNGWKREREEDTALETLRDRYARGEIDKKEFEEKKKDLE